MMQIAVLSISTILAGSFVGFGQLDKSIDVEFAQIVKNRISKFSVEFSKILFDDLEPNKNLVFSPFNIYVGLALMHLGATNTTKNELSDVLGFPTEESKLPAAHEYLGNLLNDLLNSNKPCCFATVNIANRVFIQKGINVNEKYVERATNYYNDGFQQVDFANDGPEATNFINKWIAENTENRIPSMLQDELPTDTTILSASVSQFSGMLQHSFAFTEMKSFYTGTKSVLVPTMRVNTKVYHFNNTILKFEAIKFHFWDDEDRFWYRPWKGGYNILVILPQKGESMKTLISSFKPEHFLEAINSFKEVYMECEIPNFKFGWSQDIIQHLKSLGVKQIFEKVALNNMTHLNNSMISKVTHAAGIKFVTPSTIELPKRLRVPPPPVQGTFHANRPFLFTIYHEQNRHILLTGLVQNPADGNV